MRKENIKDYHISDAVIEPDDKGEEDKEERDCVLMGDCQARKPGDQINNDGDDDNGDNNGDIDNHVLMNHRKACKPRDQANQ